MLYGCFTLSSTVVASHLKCLSDANGFLCFIVSAVPKLLVDLHVKLLRKIGKSVSADRWEKYLVKVSG